LDSQEQNTPQGAGQDAITTPGKQPGAPGQQQYLTPQQFQAQQQNRKQPVPSQQYHQRK
jgi:hypothetical protein